MVEGCQEVQIGGSMGVVGEICCGFIGAFRGLLESPLWGHLGVIWGYTEPTSVQH